MHFAKLLCLVTIGLFISFSGVAEIIGYTPCVNGFAGKFECKNMNLLSRIPLDTQGIPGAKMGNDLWGWTDPETKREYVIMGLTNKASIVDVTDARNPKHVLDIPSAGNSSIWRDIKVYKNHAYIVSEAMGHGMQVVDLTQLRALQNAKPEKLPKILSPITVYSLFGSAHNIAINENSGFAYAVGTTTCDAGLHVVDIRNPVSPQFSTCVDKTIFEGVQTKTRPIRLLGAGDTYTHDVHCVNYHGPDLRYSGREICIASNSDSINIVDVTDKANPKQIAVTSYYGYGFTHQGWLTDNHRYYLQGDELDEIRHSHNTKTYIYDFSDLENPRQIGIHEYETKAVDHNIYINGNLAFAANYMSGLRVLDIHKIAEASLTEVAFFDFVPEQDPNDEQDMYGAWSVYPFFASGTIAISGMDSALYLVELDPKIAK